jgi:hypothetical protein
VKGRLVFELEDDDTGAVKLGRDYLDGIVDDNWLASDAGAGG